MVPMSICCIYSLLSISRAVTQLSYTTTSRAPSIITCNDVTGCEITCTGDNACNSTTIDSLSASYLTITALGASVLEDTAINCPSNAECTITAIGVHALASSSIYCGINGVCDITGGDEASLYMAYIEADSSTKLTITADGGYLALSQADIYCPRNQATPSCTIRLRSDSSPYWSSSLGGPIMEYVYFYIDSADEIEFRCDASTNWDAFFTTDTAQQTEVWIYGDYNNGALCSIEVGSYSASDFYGTNILECMYKYRGSQVNWLSGSNRCIPWFTTSPTAEPSSSPTAITLNPTNKPTVSPTKSPTDFPTLSPTKRPTATPTSQTLHPSQTPTTGSPTNIPTSSPTAAPSVSPTNTPTSSSLSPSFQPTIEPTLNTKTPSKSPTIATNDPTSNPTKSPTSLTKSPTEMTEYPTKSPTEITEFPTKSPTEMTEFPTLPPSKAPSRAPIEVLQTTDGKDNNIRKGAVTMEGLMDNLIVWILLIGITCVLLCFGGFWLVFLCRHCMEKRQTQISSSIIANNVENRGEIEPRNDVIVSDDESYGSKIELPPEIGIMASSKKHERVISESNNDDILLGPSFAPDADNEEYLDICTDCTSCKMGKTFDDAFYCNSCWEKYAKAREKQQVAIQTAGGRSSNEQQHENNDKTRMLNAAAADSKLVKRVPIISGDAIINADKVMQGSAKLTKHRSNNDNQLDEDELNDDLNEDDDDSDSDSDSMYDAGVTTNAGSIPAQEE